MSGVRPMRAALVPALAGAAFCWCAAARPAPADAFRTALGKAEAAEQQAGLLKNQWTTTETALQDARKAAAAGNYREAVSRAQFAQALAEASIAQAREQASAWKSAVIR